jgi:transcriptional regulator with XRE-family HTH domain
MSNAAMGTAGLQDGMRIRLLRTERDITVREFARRIGIGSPYLSKIERRHVPANLSILVRIAREFGVPVDSLIDRDRISELAADSEAA